MNRFRIPFSETEIFEGYKVRILCHKKILPSEGYAPHPDLISLNDFIPLIIKNEDDMNYILADPKTIQSIVYLGHAKEIIKEIRITSDCIKCKRHCDGVDCIRCFYCPECCECTEEE